jgi:TonB-linked SusC/RagA family outer membrane protein
MKKAFFLWLVGLLFTSAQLFAQGRTVSGVVTDADDGEPLIGVSVLVKGTSVGTVTDIDGKYSLEVPDGGETLVFSYVGYTTFEAPISGTSVNVKLNSGVELEETVVLGYQTVKKSDVTSAVSTIGGEKLENALFGNVANSLQGLATGVQVTARSGAPGANAFIRIRGVGSYNASNEPLFVVDGVQVTANYYNSLNPNDIESINILKDASAAAIYGVKGGNGVVVITTKSGRFGQTKPVISYTYQYGFKERIKDNFSIMNAEQKLRYEKELADLGVSQALGTPGATASPEELDFLLKYARPWEDIITQRGKLSTHDISVTGGGQNVSYFMSFGKYNEDGLVKAGSFFERLNARFRVDYKAAKWLDVGHNITVSRTQQEITRDRYNVQNPFNALYTYNPYETEFVLDDEGNPVLDANGRPVYNLTHQGFPITEALVNNPEQLFRDRIIANAYAQANIIEGLTVRTNIGSTFERYRRESYVKPGSVLDGYVGNPAQPGIKTDNGYDDFYYIWTNTANYTKTFKSVHNISVLAGTELQSNTFDSYSVQSRGFANPNITTQNAAAAIVSGSSARTQEAFFSLFGEAKYNYAQKYYGSVLFRRDGNSNFGSDNRYANFWAVSAAYNIANEDFLKSVSWIDQLKIRGSVGTSGNPTTTRYANLGLFGFGNYAGVTASRPTQIENPELRWEKNFNYTIGLDFGLFKNRLSASVDYFSRTTEDLLLNAQVAYESGGTIGPAGSPATLQNVGSFQNKGVELEVRGVVLTKKNVQWDVFFQYTTVNSEVLTLATEDDLFNQTGITILRPGLQLNTFYLTRWAGVDPATGQELFYDKEGNITTTYSDGNAVALEGKTPQPRHFGSFGTNLQLGNGKTGLFDISAMFYYALGGYTMNYIWRDLNSDGEGVVSQQAVDAFNYWKNPGDVVSNPRPTGRSFSSDRWLQKSDYLRLRNLQVGYTFPKSILSKVKVQELRLFAQAQNLFTFRPQFKGDPEQGESGTETSTPQVGEIALFGYPNAVGVTFGVNIQF